MSWLKSFKGLNGLEKVLTCVFSLVILLKFIESFVPMQHGDALSYHLVLPKLILERGFFQAHHDFYLGNIAGLFDYLYLIPQLLFESKLIAQISSQFLHTSVSLFLGVFVFYQTFARQSLTTFYLASICLLTFSRGPDFFIYAKNDGALAITFLLGSLLVFNKIGTTLSENKKSLLVGICLGLMPAIKMSGLIYTVALALFFLFKNRSNLKNIIIAACTSFLILSITLIKNWYFVGNPLFPAFLEVFPTKATPEMIFFMNGMLKRPASLQGILQNYLIAFSPKIIGILVIPGFIYNLKKGRKEINQFVYLILLFTTLYCLINPGYPAHRFYFGCHFILLYFLAETFFFFFNETKLIKSRVIFVLLMLTFADSKIDKVIKRDFDLLKNLTSLGVGKKLLHNYIPHTKIWDQVENNSNILSDRMPMQFYAPKGSLLYQAGHAQKANFIRSCSKLTSEEVNYFSYLIINKEIDECGFFAKIPKSLIHEHGNYELYKILQRGGGK